MKQTAAKKGTTTRGRKAQGTNNKTQKSSTATKKTTSSTNKDNMKSNTSKESNASKNGTTQFNEESPLEKFFLAQLKDIYYAEQKITKALPKMQEAATTESLKDAFEDHLLQTQRQIKRLEKAFELLGKKATGEKCEAIEGIAKEVEDIIDETEEGTLTRDAALILAAQKVEHYEIATYGGLVQLAITMELHEVADLLDKTLVEEEDTDSLLTEIAENEINLGAEHEGNQYSWENKEQEAEMEM